MGTGFLTIQTRTAENDLPVPSHVTITHKDGTVFYETDTDQNGNTENFPLSAPDVRQTLDSTVTTPAYSVCDVNVYADGFATVHIRDVEIVDTQVTILPVKMQPLSSPAEPEETDIYIPPIALLDTAPRHQTDPSPRAIRDVIIPDYITVHLGTPTNASARNVRVKFLEYVKNVVSSEIYSTWPYSSLVANVHVIVTFALNRVYTEWYRSRGFNFDITNSTAYDQFYRDGGPIFENVSQIVDGIFNVYARRQGFQNPFFTQFCNGTTATCNGLSQWGTVSLANQGLTPIQILHYYYPDDLELVASNNVTGITASFPGAALTIGSQGSDVLRMQNFLNRIRVNFPLIPRITNPDGIFGPETQAAVRTFQRSFNLTADGVIGRDTWNKISFIHTGVIRLGELDSEGVRVGLSPTPPTVTISQGARGHEVLELQFILNAISPFYPTIPGVIKDSVFDTVTKNSVIEFQKAFNLTPDGVVGPATWNKLYSVYRGIRENAPLPPNPAPPTTNAPPYPGAPLKVGSSGANVRLIQTYLNTIRIVYPSIPYLVVDGAFGEGTRNAVLAFQREFVLTPDGVVGPVTWDYIIKQYLLVTGNAGISLEYPGVPLSLGSSGSAVRLMQTLLSDLRAAIPSIPALTSDGIFGPNTQSAVTAFQRAKGLTPDGVIGPVTWDAIIRERNAGA